jgi:hypothetical protein
VPPPNHRARRWVSTHRAEVTTRRLRVAIGATAPPTRLALTGACLSTTRVDIMSVVTCCICGL